MQNNKNILIATILSTLILLSWTWFYEKPRLEKQEAAKKAVAQTMPVAENQVFK